MDTVDSSLKGIYFVQAVTGGPIKIGVASNVYTRLKGIQTGSPVKLQIIAFVPDDDPRFLEGLLHERFAQFRLEGEWFQEHEALTELVKKAERRYPLETYLHAVVRQIQERMCPPRGQRVAAGGGIIQIEKGAVNE